VHRLVHVIAVAAVLAAVPTAAASPTVRLAILHWVNGCHVWSSTERPTARIVLARGGRIVVRPSCPMDFDLVQVAGPRLALGGGRLYAGTSRALVFRTRGIYRLVARNVQSSEQVGLQTLGPDNALTLTVVVR